MVKKLRQTVTLQLSFPLRKKVYLFSFSYLFCFAALLLVGLFSGAALAYLAAGPTLEAEFKKQKQAALALEKAAARFKQQAERIERYQLKYGKEMEQILILLGLEQGADFWRLPNNEILELLKPVEARPVQVKLETQQLSKLAENQRQLLSSFAHLESLENYLELRNELREHLPLGWPVLGDRGYKTSGYGMRFSPFNGKKRFHTGVDIGAFPGTAITAVAAGRVLVAGERTGYGKLVILLHKYGHRTVYAHNRENLVEVGQQVKKGQPIATVGNTGHSTGYHVHFEVLLGRQHTDPWPYIITAF